MLILSLSACFLFNAVDGTPVAPTGTPDDPATEDPPAPGAACGWTISRVFPRDGADGIFMSPFFDVPRVETDDELTIQVVADDGFEWTEAFERQDDGAYEPDLGLGGGTPRERDLSIVATDGDGCEATLSTFTTGPWGFFEPSVVYDGVSVRLSLVEAQAEHPSLQFVRTLHQLEQLPLITLIDDAWASVSVDERLETSDCSEPTFARNGGTANGVLFVTGLDGTAVDPLDLSWVNVDFDVLVDPDTGRWDRVLVEGMFDLGPEGGSYCGTGLVECIVCPDSGLERCIDLTGLDFVGEPLDYTYSEPTCEGG